MPCFTLVAPTLTCIELSTSALVITVSTHQDQTRGALDVYKHRHCLPTELFLQPTTFAQPYILLLNISV